MANDFVRHTAEDESLNAAPSVRGNGQCARRGAGGLLANRARHAHVGNHMDGRSRWTARGNPREVIASSFFFEGEGAVVDEQRFSPEGGHRHRMGHRHR